MTNHAISDKTLAAGEITSIDDISGPADSMKTLVSPKFCNN